METVPSNKHKTRLKRIGLICIILGIAFYIFPTLSTPKVSDENIKVIKGTMRKYTFSDMGRQRYDYTIFLNGDFKTYQIIASTHDVFKKQDFENDIHKYDSLEFKYLVPGAISLNNSLTLIEIKSNGKIYLSKNDSQSLLKTDNSFTNVASIGFIIIGLIMFGRLLIYSKSNNT